MDVSAAGTTAGNGLPLMGLPPGTKPVAKRLFLDFLDPKFGLAGSDFPEKIEGLTWGPDLPDGRRLLVVTHRQRPDEVQAEPLLGLRD